MYTVFLCPKCRGQGTTSCKLCSGLSKRVMGELTIGQCMLAAGPANSVVTFAAVPAKLMPATLSHACAAGWRIRGDGQRLIMSRSEPLPFSCPSCEAKYHIITVDTPADTQDDRVCLRCGALFPSRGAFLRYFRVGRPRPPYIRHKRGPREKS